MKKKKVTEKTIGGMTFEDFKSIMEKNEEIYQENVKNGSRLKNEEEINLSSWKFAWSSTCDSGYEKFIDEYHRNIKSFDKAYNEVTKMHLKKLKESWGINKEEVKIIGSSPFMEEHEYNEKELSKEDIFEIVKRGEKVVFRMEYQGDDNKKKGCRQEWSSIMSMAVLDNEENELKKMFQQEAQEEANRTGKKAIVTNFVGWTFEAEPEGVNKQ